MLYLSLYNENMIDIEEHWFEIQKNAMEYEVEFIIGNNIDELICNINDIFSNFGYYFTKVYENNNTIFNKYIKEYKTQINLYKRLYIKKIVLTNTYSYNYKHDFNLDYKNLTLSDGELKFNLEKIKSLNEKNIKKYRNNIKNDISKIRGKILCQQDNQIEKQDFKNEIINILVDRKEAEICIDNNALILINKIKKYNDILLTKAIKFCEDYVEIRKEFLNDYNNKDLNRKIYKYVTTKVIEFRELVRIYNELLFTVMEIALIQIKQNIDIIRESEGGI